MCTDEWWCAQLSEDDKLMAERVDSTNWWWRGYCDSLGEIFDKPLQMVLDKTESLSS